MIKRITKSLMLILVVASAASSQSVTGSISGTLQDMFGAVIPALEIRLVRLTKQKEETVSRTKSDQNGDYSFSNVPLGVYEIQVKWFSDEIIRKRIELTSSQPIQKSFDISNKPCSDRLESTEVTPITNSERAEIVRELLNLKFPQPLTEKIIFVPRNIDVAWLNADHKAKLNIMTKSEVQALAEKKNHQVYHWISSIKQTGGCVEISINEDVAMKGQLEDANMAGGGMVYEFRKVAGRWIGQAVGGWIS